MKSFNCIDCTEFKDTTTVDDGMKGRGIGLRRPVRKDDLWNLSNTNWKWPQR
jgi:hypothetical protein